MWESLGGFFDGIGGALDSFGTKIKPFGGIMDLGLGLYGMNQAEKMSDKQRDAAMQMEREKYDNALQMMNAANAFGASGGGGGGGGANRAAQAANEAARLKALQKSMKYEKKMGKKARQELQPYADTGKRLLPAVEQTYGNSLSGMNSMMAFLQQPEQMKKLENPAGIKQAELPAFMRGGKR
jgi:hypothetical protein